MQLRFPELYRDECVHGVDYQMDFYEIEPEERDGGVTVRIERVAISRDEQAAWQNFLRLLAHELSPLLESAHL
jgi:hypothetical protein